MLLLRVLTESEDYGYSVVVRLQDHGFEGLTEGTVYPALTRLEGKGLLASRLVASTSGPARKYYRPTAVGAQELVRATEAFAALTADVARVMGGAPSTGGEATEHGDGSAGAVVDDDNDEERKAMR